MKKSDFYCKEDMISIIDENNYKKNNEILDFVFGGAETYVHSSIVLEKDIIELCVLQEREIREIFSTGENEVELIVVNGKVLNKYLSETGIYARTFFVEKNLKVFIIFDNNLKLLRRLLTHEYVHCIRLKNLNIESDREYIRYFSNVNNWIIEEVFAVAAEKRICQIETWEEAIGFEFNPEWKLIRKKDLSFEKIAEKVQSKEIIEYVKSLKKYDFSVMYYIVYVISKKIEIDSQIEFLLGKSSKEIETYITNI